MSLDNSVTSIYQLVKLAIKATFRSLELKQSHKITLPFYVKKYRNLVVQEGHCNQIGHHIL